MSSQWNNVFQKNCLIHLCNIPKVLTKELHNIRGMSNEETVELWKKYIANPEAIGEIEKPFWMKLQRVISDILIELKTNNKIEINFTHSELGQVKKMLKNRNHISDNFSRIVDTTDSLEKANSFVRAIGEFGFTESNYVYLIVELSIMSLITDSESFKTLFLFHLKDINYKATDFSVTLRRFAPHNWKRLEPFINNKFRNSLAHGTWAMENNEIVLFEDAKLVQFEKLTVGEFLGKVKEQHILFGCLSSVISDKIDKGFFT